MTTGLDDLRILKQSEEICDGIWSHVENWQEFARRTVGVQIVRAADSIGANIAESFGRFNYGEKITFLYYARGSLFETKFWLNRASTRKLISQDDVALYQQRMSDLARQLNSFLANIKAQRAGNHSTRSNTLREERADYLVFGGDEPDCLFTEEEIAWLQSLISNP